MATKKLTKAQKAENVFNKFYGKVDRKEIIRKFQLKSVGLTANGASTYYQNLVRKAKAAEGESEAA